MRNEVLGNRYRVLELIGEGGMAYVYLAMDEKLGRKVAVKVLHHHMEKNPDIRARFQQEAQAISALDHPNIVKIYDFSGNDSPRLWIVTEVIRGKNLAQYVHKDKNGWLHPVVAACIVREICKALTKAHEHGIVHRDIKPENIMMTYEGRIKLMDFGIAKDTSNASMTVTGTFMGSPSYMSPEQIRGREVDLRSDLYSLSVLFYEIVTGRLPFTGATTHDVILKIMDGGFTHPRYIVPTLPDGLNNIIVKGMAKAPAQRYQSATAYGTELEQILKDLGFDESHVELERYCKDKARYEQRLTQTLANHGLAHSADAATPSSGVTLAQKLRQDTKKPAFNPPKSRFTSNRPLQSAVRPEPNSSRFTAGARAGSTPAPVAPASAATAALRTTAQLHQVEKPAVRPPSLPPPPRPRAVPAMTQASPPPVALARADARGDALANLNPKAAPAANAVARKVRAMRRAPSPRTVPPSSNWRSHLMLWIMSGVVAVLSYWGVRSLATHVPRHGLPVANAGAQREGTGRQVKGVTKKRFAFNRGPSGSITNDASANAGSTSGRAAKEGPGKTAAGTTRRTKRVIDTAGPSRLAAKGATKVEGAVDGRSAPAADIEGTTRSDGADLRRPKRPAGVELGVDGSDAPVIAPSLRLTAKSIAKGPGLASGKDLAMGKKATTDDNGEESGAKTQTDKPRHGDGAEKSEAADKNDKPVKSEAAKPQTPGKGRVLIASQPAAEIFIDGRRFGTTNDNTVDSGWLPLPSGRHNLELRRQGYNTQHLRFDLAAEEQKVLPRLALEAQSSAASLKTPSAEATVLTLRVNLTPVQVSLRNLDTNATNTFSMTGNSKNLPLAPGHYQIRFEHNGEVKERDLTISGSQGQLTYSVDFKDSGGDN